MKQIHLLGLFSLPFLLNAQTDSSEKKSPFVFTGYLETYYSYNFAQPDDHLNPFFLYNFKRHNEVNLNLGYYMGSYNSDDIRGNLAMMVGTYAQYNLSSEHPVFQHLLQADVGVKLAKKKNLWVDAGVMPSHIGFESATGKVCWNLTRGILAENSPYYESGVKLNYTSDNSKWYMAALLLNGWQHIQRVPGCNTPSGGTQLTWIPSQKFTFNWSTFVGNEYPDSIQRWRYFNNFYIDAMLHKKFEVIAGFDIGYQQQSKGSSNYDVWWTPVLVLHYLPTKKINIGARAEYYSDEKGVIIPTNTPNGFQVYSYSCNFDYHIKGHITWRIEYRVFGSKDAIFSEKSHLTNKNYMATTSLAIQF